MKKTHHVIIIGAGLSGLYSAWKLQQLGLDVLLLEARSRIGGRVLSAGSQESLVDMGPAWVWPQFQIRLQRLMQELGIATFKQHALGDTLYQKSDGSVERYRAQSAHRESSRIEGSGQRLIEALQAKVGASAIRLNSVVACIDQNAQSPAIRIKVNDGEQACEYHADKLILALPPRLFLQDIAFMPDFETPVRGALSAIPTWMAGHSKMVFIYERSFWREAGLSGEVFSHRGPLSEIYDATPADETCFALTSFAGLATQQRAQIGEQDLIDACMAQLQKLFGDESQNPVDIHIRDWSKETFTSAQADLNSPMQHPHYPQDMPRSFWDGRLILAGTEVAPEHGGYLEGALESADEAVRLCQGEETARV